MNTDHANTGYFSNVKPTMYEFPNKHGKLHPLYVQIYHKGHRFQNCYDSSNSNNVTNYMVELERGVRFNELTKCFFWELKVPGGKVDTVKNKLKEDSLTLLEPGVAYRMEDSALELRTSDLKYMLMTIMRVTCSSTSSPLATLLHQSGCDHSEYQLPLSPIQKRPLACQP